MKITTNAAWKWSLVKIGFKMAKNAVMRKVILETSRWGKDHIKDKHNFPKLDFIIAHGLLFWDAIGPYRKLWRKTLFSDWNYKIFGNVL